MDSAAAYAPFQERLKSSLMQASKTANRLSLEDLAFHRSSNAELSDSLDEQSGRLISLTSKILKAATGDTDLPAPTLKDEDSIEDNWRGVVDVIDALLERADSCLDEFTGVIKRLSPSQQDQEGEAAANPVGKKTTSSFPSIYRPEAARLPKPQLHFNRKVNNADVSPFKPLLRSKPHAIEPLEKSLDSPDPKLGYKNPYEEEIRALKKYPKSAYEVAPPIDYKPWESTTAIFVDTMDGVKEMLAALKSADVIAVDLEHHDQHSYQGIVSLMQVSTRDQDWIVDTLKPWREDLQILNEVFADPRIIKVLHGSYMDIIWLQRDLGLYVVGLFDTYHATNALNYPRHNLKFLLEKFVNFDADKQYQLADWRIRPLTSEMFDYARADTHFLLYIYDHLRNELVQHSTPDKNLVDYVLEKSNAETLKRFERPVYDAEKGQGAGGWYDFLVRNPVPLSREQFSVFRAVHQWRDEVAREEDVAVHAILPKHALFRLAHAMPVDRNSMLEVRLPPTTFVRDRVPNLIETIKKAKAEGVNGPEWRDFYVKPKKTGHQTAPAVEAESGLLTPPAGDLPIAGRCEVSQFWGNVLNLQQSATPPAEYSAVAGAEALRLSLPLPPMPRTVSEAKSQAGVTTPKPAPPPPAETAPPQPAREEEDKNKVFTVKGMGGPRKRKAAPAEEAPKQDDLDGLNVNEVTAEADAADDKAVKKQRRKEKKDKKEKKKAAAEATSQEGDAPFNYDAAESVLHSQSAKQGSGLPKKPYNPYAKALDAPSGVRKQKKEMQGKAFTFR